MKTYTFSDADRTRFVELMDVIAGIDATILQLVRQNGAARYSMELIVKEATGLKMAAWTYDRASGVLTVFEPGDQKAGEGTGVGVGVN